MGQATLSNYEKGRRDIPAVTLVSVAGALGLSIGEVLDVDHILIVRDERMREAVRILVRSPDVLDAIVGPRPPPPPRPPRRRKADPGEQDGDEAGEADGESTDAADAGAAAAGEQDDGNGSDGESNGAEGDSSDAEGESNGAGGERIGADDPGGVAPPDTGTQA